VLQFASKQLKKGAAVSGYPNPDDELAHYGPRLLGQRGGG
jgi:hypothetical protein